jgi:hypothetical protein
MLWRASERQGTGFPHSPAKTNSARKCQLAGAVQFDGFSGSSGKSVLAVIIA